MEGQGGDLGATGESAIDVLFEGVFGEVFEESEALVYAAVDCALLAEGEVLFEGAVEGFGGVEVIDHDSKVVSDCPVEDAFTIAYVE